MNQQPDKLFREKLENLQKSVPPAAWNRVESGLNKKNDPKRWLKIAASLLLAGVATALLVPALRTSHQAQVSHKTESRSDQHQKQDIQKPTASPDEIKTGNEKAGIAKTETEKQQNRKIRIRKNRQRQEATSPKPVKPEDSFKNEILVTETNIPEEKPVKISDQAVASEATTKTVASSKKTSGIVLIYTAEEVNEKYLDKKALAEATSEEKKPSTLRKLIDTAYDLKHNQDPFADLRQKKNEILALNFKSEKRSQNK